MPEDPNALPEGVTRVRGDIYASSNRPDRKLNQFSDRANMATLTGGQPAPRPQPGQAGYGNPVLEARGRMGRPVNPAVQKAAETSDVRGRLRDSARHLVSGEGDRPGEPGPDGTVLPSSYQRFAQIYGEEDARKLTGIESELQDRRRLMQPTGGQPGGGTFSVVPSGVDPTQTSEQRLLAARQAQGLDEAGTGPSRQAKQDLQLRAEGNVALASDATPKERRLAKRSKMLRSLMDTNVGFDQSFGRLAKSKAMRRDLIREIKAMDKQAEVEATSASEEAKLTRGTEEKRLDRAADIKKAEISGGKDPAAIAKLKFLAENVFKGQPDAIKLAVDLEKRMKGKGEKEYRSMIYRDVAKNGGTPEESKKAALAFGAFMREYGKPEVRPLIGPDGKPTGEKVYWKDGKLFDVATDKEYQKPKAAPPPKAAEPKKAKPETVIQKKKVGEAKTKAPKRALNRPKFDRTPAGAKAEKAYEKKLSDTAEEVRRRFGVGTIQTMDPETLKFARLGKLPRRVRDEINRILKKQRSKQMVAKK